jgi:hypothetical protein
MITIKFVSKGMQSPGSTIVRQIPHGIGNWDQYRFIDDPNLQEYDWLLVYDDLANQSNERYSTRIEDLACPRENTIFVMAEPSSIKTYGYDFLNQFGTIISCHGKHASPSQKTRRTIPGLVWFYGRDYVTPYSAMRDNPPLHKTGVISMVYSAKAMTHTLHGKRQNFMQRMSELMPELDIFGKGYIPLPDKQDCLNPYKYHIAIENTLYPNYISEKITDPFLGLCLPFYIGAPNTTEYFAPESFIALDFDNPEKSVEIIREAIRNNEYEKRLPALIEARRQVMEDYNLFAIAKSIIEEREAIMPSHTLQRKPFKLYSRRAILKKNPWIALRFLIEKTTTRLIQRIKHKRHY